MEKVSDVDIRQSLAAIKECVREVIMAYREGAGSPGAPMTADLAVAAIWREIDLRAEAIGALDDSFWFRVEVDPSKLLDFVDGIEAGVLYETLHCVGARHENDSTIVYLTTKHEYESNRGASYGADVLRWLLEHPAVISVRDWRWY